MGQMNAFAAAVAFAALVTGAAGEPEPSASMSVTPLIAHPSQVTRIKVRVTADEERFLNVHVHPGTSRCAATVGEEWDRWPEPHGQNIREAGTRAGTDVVSATFYGEPGTYRACAYIENDDMSVHMLVTAILRIRALNRVMRIGRGIGPWRLKERYVRRAGYERKVPDTQPVASCRRSFWQATRVDAYTDGIKVAWVGGALASVRTELRGDRSHDGFVIGTASLRGVRGRHPSLRVTSGFFWPGADIRHRMVVVSKATTTGVAELRYWFDPSGILFALEASERRC